MQISEYIDKIPFNYHCDKYISTGWISYKPENESLILSECSKRENMSVCRITKKFRLYIKL